MKTVARAHLGLHTAALVLSVAVAGCGSSPLSAHSPPDSRHPVEPPGDATALVPATARQSDPCNVRAGEVQVGAQIIERGAALVFTTSDDVRQLRQRVAESAVLAPPGTRPPRSDNVRRGVRLVFEAETAGDRAVVQRVVRDHAREIAKTCGMVLAAPGEGTAEPEREESRRAAADPFASPSEETPAPKPTEPPAGGSDGTKPPLKIEVKPDPEPAKPPKPENEPKDADKPGGDKKPKDDEKPPLPRLPDGNPDPIAPDENE